MVAEYLRGADAPDLRELLADIDQVFVERVNPEVDRLVRVHLVNFDFKAAGFPDAWAWLEVVRERMASRLTTGSGEESGRT